MSKTHAELCVSNYVDAEAMPTVEWKITCYFYSAVHALDHALWPGSHAPDRQYGHPERERRVLGDTRLKTILRRYNALKTLATTARYMPWQHPMTPTNVQYAGNLAREIAKFVGIDLPTP